MCVTYYPKSDATKPFQCQGAGITLFAMCLSYNVYHCTGRISSKVT
ncbi:hypothetical protein [Wolbachia endosymbiont of Drosophila bicornuta]